MSDRRLIVNADDFNSDPQRSRGILEAAEKGIVTSTTALANLPWEATTVAALRDVFGAGVGVHLNLTMGRPLTGGRTLVDGDDCFLDKGRAWRRALRGGYDVAEVETEFAAQIARLLDLGIVPSHLDGNNHIHVFPGIAPVVARLAVRFGIDRVRLPLERHRGRGGQFKRRGIGLLARAAARHFRATGLAFPDHFAGIAVPRPGCVASLCTLLHALPAGVTELMCHPGYRSEAPFATSERERELTALIDPSVVGAAQGAGIRLISFADLAPR